jgi:dolichyl-phosphate beta-glucosyltransferase
LIYSALIYSIVIPAYNESVRIRPTLHELLRYISEQNWDAEILVVNDGSSDDTAQIVREYGAVHPQVLLIENPGNRGKGFSVRNGMLHARGDICLFTDADLSSPITEAPKLFDAIDRGADIAIGSRWLQTELQTGPQPLYRQLFGRIFNLA